MTPAEILEERLSDITLRRTKDPAKVDALYAAALVAIPAVLRAAAAGNEQCKDARAKMFASLNTLCK